MNKKIRIILSLVVLGTLILFLYLKEIRPLLYAAYNGKVSDVVFDIKGYSEFKIDNG